MKKGKVLERKQTNNGLNRGIHLHENRARFQKKSGLNSGVHLHGNKKGDGGGGWGGGGKEKDLQEETSLLSVIWF